MPQSAYIRVPKRNGKEPLSYADVKAAVEHYIEITLKTGKQLDWPYEQAAFPYSIEVREEGERRWFYLKGKDPMLYKVILIGVGEDGEDSVVQITLTDISTHGDKGKANELARYLAKKLKGSLTLFNGRIQSFV